MNIFLSFSFRDEDKELVELLQTLLRSHSVRPVTGRVLNGEPVTPAVLKKVEACDGIIALMTRRDRVDGRGDEWHTHPWVRDEITHGRAHGIRSIALVEDGVRVEGAYAENERIPLSRGAPLDAFLRLTERLSNWKRECGRTLQAKILPPTLAHGIRNDPAWKCWYRFWAHGQAGDWIEGNLVPVEGGTQLFIHGVQDDSNLVEVEIRKNNVTVWRSPATSQYITISLTNGAV
jgi:hypothetical protein